MEVNLSAYQTSEREVKIVKFNGYLYLQLILKKDFNGIEFRSCSRSEYSLKDRIPNILSGLLSRAIADYNKATKNSY